MRILTLSNYFPEHMGGIEFVAQNLVRRWRQRHRVRWMACVEPRHPHNGVPDDVPLPAWNFTEEHLGFPYPLPWPGTLPTIFREVRHCEMLHLHDCLYLANVLAFIAARMFGKPVLVTQHVGPVSYHQRYKNLLQYIAYSTLGKYILENANQVVFVSRRVQEWFESRMHLRQAGLLIPNGVENTIFYPADEEERHLFRAQLGLGEGQITVLFVGRFTEKKGLHLVRKLCQVYHHILWVMIGEGEINPRDWNLPNVWVFPPQPQSSLRRFYITADLLLLPSQGEGFPLTAQEAMACGLPVAVSHETAANLPEAPLIALDVSSPESLLCSFRQILGDRDNLSLLRRSCAEFAHRWDWEEVAKAYENLFRALA